VFQIHGSRSERQMQIATTAFIVVDVNVFEPAPIRRKYFVGRICRNLQIGVPDIQMQPELR